MPSVASSPRSLIAVTLAAFASFGAFWGAWGASIPRIRDQAGVNDAELGFALLCIGAGALPAMLLTGNAVDRWGLRVAAWLILVLGLAGAAVSLTSTGLWQLVAGLLVVGMASGSADVAMNSVAGRVEQVATRPVITHAHGLLSAFVVVGSLGAAAVAWAKLPLAIPFIVIAVMSAAAAIAMFKILPAGEPAPATDEPRSPLRLTKSMRISLLLVGILGAFAFASEGAHQNWSALFARDMLGASDGRAALAPALFATVVAISRLTLGPLGTKHPRVVLMAGGAAAAIGSSIIAISHGLIVFGIGLIIAGAGAAILFPTVLGIVARDVDEDRRGRATSLVTTVSYLGFLLAPAYVGLWASAFDLRVAMVAVAALGALLYLLATPLLGRSGYVRR
ncbi:MAG: MFS transporter [Gaiellales bacterium]